MRSLISKLYTAYIGRRNRKFDTGAGINSVDVPVISVGNITMGGTGKTPFVQFLSRELMGMGRKIAIVSRGYGRRSKGVVEVSDGQHVLVNVEQSGDELQLLAQTVRDAVVVAAEVRYYGATRALRNYGVDCIIIDDGFQHRQFHRDADIVLVDRNTLSYPQVMPLGMLREPIESLRRADVLCCVGDVRASEIPVQTNALIIEAQTLVRAYTKLDTIHSAPKPERALVVAAIANPERVVQSLEQEGIQCVGTLFFRDHQRYGQEHLRAMVNECARLECQHIITTQKDAVKLQQYASVFDRARIEITAVEIKTQLRSGASEFRRYLEQILTTTTNNT